MYFGSLKERLNRAPKTKSYLPFVSVIVPARNEENNIGICIDYLTKSSYPVDRFEIIVVNDRSNDNTPEILNNLQNSISNLKVIHVTESNKLKNLKGKPGALQTGINNAQGEILLMTDADCKVNQNWISSIVNEFSNPEIGLVASFTLVEYKTLFEKIQAVEWIYLHSMASAGVGFKQPLGCFGNNLSIRKSVMDELGGYDNIKFSLTEDLALLQAVSKTKHKIRYINDYDSSVVTFPCTNLKEYISQHRRWTIGGMDLGWRAVIFVLSSVLMWLGVLSAALTQNWEFVAIIIALRIISDFTVIMPSTKILKQDKLKTHLLLSIILLMVLELITPSFLLNRKVIWKGQVFRK